VAVVEMLFQGTALPLIIATRRGAAWIAGTVAQDDAIDRALLVAEDLGHAIALQSRRVPPADEIMQNDIIVVKRSTWIVLNEK
jgi:hypothetical protein